VRSSDGTQKAEITITSKRSRNSRADFRQQQLNGLIALNKNGLTGQFTIADSALSTRPGWITSQIHFKTEESGEILNLKPDEAAPHPPRARGYPARFSPDTGTPDWRPAFFGQ
jgi:hypothetical protein